MSICLKQIRPSTERKTQTKRGSEGAGRRRAARVMAQKTSSLGSTIAERVEQHNKTKNKTHSADLKRTSLRSGMALAKTKRKTKRGKQGCEHQALKGQQLSGRSTKTKRKQNTKMMKSIMFDVKNYKIEQLCFMFLTFFAQMT